MGNLVKDYYFMKSHFVIDDNYPLVHRTEAVGKSALGLSGRLHCGLACHIGQPKERCSWDIQLLCGIIGVVHTFC